MPGTEVEGRYRAVLTDFNGDTKVDTGWIHNLLTNKGVEKMGAGFNRPFVTGWLGSGSTSPAYTDVGVESLVWVSANGKAGTENSWERLETPTYGVRSGYSWTWPTGQATATLREFCTTASYDYHYLRASDSVTMRVLFPVPIVKEAMDQLTVYYEYFTYPELSDISGVVDIQGVPYDYTARIFKINALTKYPTGGISSFDNGGYFHAIINSGNSHPNLVPITGTASNTYSRAHAMGASSYTGIGTGSVTQTSEIIWGIDRGNVGEFRNVYILTNQFAWNAGGGIQISIGKTSDGTKHLKENTHELMLSASVSTTRIP